MPAIKANIMTLTIKDRDQLYASYMPFLINGGLFIPTDKKYSFGDELFIKLILLDEPDKIPLSGKVVWLTPAGCQGNKKAGIGVQFNNTAHAVRTKIETYLATYKKSGPTLSM